MRIGLGQLLHELRLCHPDRRSPALRGMRKRAKAPGERQARAIPSPPAALAHSPGKEARERGLLTLFLGFGFGLGLGLDLPVRVLPPCPIDGRAEDVAKTGARIRRAELGHRTLFLVDLARLDRQADLARRAVDGGNLGIYLFTNRE